jgi:uncharacterized protein (DUF433 family)
MRLIAHGGKLFAGLGSWMDVPYLADKPTGPWTGAQVLEHLTAHVEPTRSEVCHVYDLLARGYTPDQIRQQYDHLTPEDIQACLAYASEILRSEKVYALPV